MAYVWSVTTPNLTRPVIPWNRFWDLKFGGITPSAIFTRFGTQRLSLLFSPKWRCTWTSYQMRWWGKKGAARVAVTATTRRLLSRNLYPPGTLEQVCRRRWGIHWRLSLYRIYFCGPGSSVSIATDYGLDGPGIESPWRRDPPHLSMPALGSTQSTFQWVPGLSRG